MIYATSVYKYTILIKSDESASLRDSSPNIKVTSLTLLKIKAKSFVRFCHCRFFHVFMSLRNRYENNYVIISNGTISRSLTILIIFRDNFFF
ncbi:hypothetical protein PUN28_005348 [Cardiocondyla obscurior]|uniref:Uncharacterized protein n=1 Tax=Cardiocondyla obscurior TaxID=286306 RepID=A0AAW2GHA1_9HYME